MEGRYLDLDSYRPKEGRGKLVKFLMGCRRYDCHVFCMTRRFGFWN